MAAYPELKLSLTVSDTRTNLIEARIDLAIAFGASLRDTDWSARRLGQFDFWLCASPHYLAQRGVPTSPEQLMLHDWLWFADDNRPVSLALNKDRTEPKEFVFTPRIVGNNQDSLQRGCLAGMGIAALASLDVSDLVDTGCLERILPEWSIRPYDIWVLTPHRDTQPSKVKRAIQALQVYLQKTPGVRI